MLLKIWTSSDLPDHPLLSAPVIKGLRSVNISRPKTLFLKFHLYTKACCVCVYVRDTEKEIDNVQWSFQTANLGMWQWGQCAESRISQPLKEQRAHPLSTATRVLPFLLHTAVKCCPFASMLHMLNKRCQRQIALSYLEKTGELHQVASSSFLYYHHGSEIVALKIDMKSSPQFL